MRSWSAVFRDCFVEVPLHCRLHYPFAVGIVVEEAHGFPAFVAVPSWEGLQDAEQRS